MKALGLVVSEKKIFSHCIPMGPNESRGRTIFDSRGMVGWIYKEDHYILLHIKYKSFRPFGFFINMAGPISIPGARLAGFI